MNKTIFVSKEHTHKIFEATVENFKRDLIYLKGCLDIIKIEREKTHYVTTDSLEHVNDHLSNMLEMLNDFEYRIKGAANE